MVGARVNHRAAMSPMKLGRLGKFHRVAKCRALKMKMLLEEHAGHMALAQRCLPNSERKTWFPEHLKHMRSARRCLANLKKLCTTLTARTRSRRCCTSCRRRTGRRRRTSAEGRRRRAGRRTLVGTVGCLNGASLRLRRSRAGTLVDTAHTGNSPCWPP